MGEISFLTSKQQSSAFWSLDTDLQLGYEVYDKSYEINAVLQAIATAASRQYVIANDDDTKMALSGIQVIASQMRNAPTAFFNDLLVAASSRSNNEAWHIARVRSSHANYDVALNVLLNATGPLSSLNGVVNPFVLSAIRSSLHRVKFESQVILCAAENITQDINKIRVNSSLLMTPELINDFIDRDAATKMTMALTTTRNNFAILLSAVRDVGRLVAARGSIHELLTRSFTKDTVSRNSALNNFVNNYNRVRNNLLSSVASYRQAAESGVSNFITRVQAMYDDTIVRPNFDKKQLPLVRAFGNVIVSKVYNQTFFQTSFDDMRDAILYSFSSATNSSLTRGSDLRDVILDLQRNSFVRRYSNCLNELVAEAQANSNTITSKYAFCLNERTSGIVVTIPSTSTWLSVIKDNINSVLQQLNSCLSGQTSVAGRTATSDCIQQVSGFSITFPYSLQMFRF